MSKILSAFFSTALIVSCAATSHAQSCPTTNYVDVEVTGIYQGSDSSYIWGKASSASLSFRINTDPSVIDDSEENRIIALATTAMVTHHSARLFYFGTIGNDFDLCAITLLIE